MQSINVDNLMMLNPIFVINFQSYPDENHAISGTGMRRHLYHSIEKFLARDCFTAEESTAPQPDPTPTVNPGTTSTATSDSTTVDPSARTTSRDTSGSTSVTYANNFQGLFLTLTVILSYTRFF